jgi:hypothetical protein
MSTWALSGAKMLRCSAILLLVGGPFLGSQRGTALRFFGDDGASVRVRGSPLGLRQVRVSTNSGGRLIACELAAGGAFTLIDAAEWMLSAEGH